MNESLQQQVNDLQIKLDTFLSEYYRNNNPTSQIFTKKVIMKGGISLDGGSLGTASDSLSVYGETPVPQASAISAPAAQGSSYSQFDVNTIVTAVNSIRTALQNFGITA